MKSSEWIALFGYVIGVLMTGRILFLLSRPRGGWRYENGRTPEQHRDDSAFGAMVFGVFWPITWGVALALLPFAAIMWLVSLPTRKDRKGVA